MDTYKYNPLLSKGLELQQEAIDVTSDDVLTSEAINYVLLPGNSFGNLTGSGTIPPGTNLQALLESALVGYLSPTFSSFSISGLGSAFITNTLERGTQIGGNRTVTWANTNAANIDLISEFRIVDTTGNYQLASTDQLDFTEPVVVANALLVNTWVFTIAATNTNNVDFSTTLTLTGSYRRFFGAVSTIPTTSAQVRALSSVFDNTSNTFILNTGSVEKIFVIAIPATKTLSTVIDLDAANALVTSEYVLSGTLTSIDDVSGSPVAYKVYINSIASVPYTNNHRHQITII